MKHGYTNDTSSDGRRVTKRYRGPEADLRRRRETAIYSDLTNQLPMPVALASEGDQLIMSHVDGLPGQELLDHRPAPVLQSIGRLARTIQLLDLDQLELPGESPTNGVLVHGDFGPQNVLLDPVSVTPTALLDWELAHYGDEVEDIAWAEWIVRMHHSPVLDHLDALFEGFGTRPAWRDRQAAMITKCEWALDFAGRWETGETPTTALWRRRLAATQGFIELRFKR